METVAGNHVNLDLGGGVYAMYAHLQPGSIRVKLGDKVTPGQVIGLLGNSGNCGEPHLHFQLMDRNSPLNSEGLPYYFPGFKLAARISGDSEGQVTEAPAHLKVNRLPAPEAHTATSRWKTKWWISNRKAPCGAVTSQGWKFRGVGSRVTRTSAAHRLGLCRAILASRSDRLVSRRFGACLSLSGLFHRSC